MFNVRQGPLVLPAERLLSVRLSLNTPVVSTPDLAPGLARAAIVAQAGTGGPSITVALRSLAGGDVVLYELEGEDLHDASGFEVGLEAALTFAESMGFLLDDELLGEHTPQAQRAALAALADVLPLPAGPAAPERAEILLDEAAEEEPAAPRPPLTKFRGGTGSAAPTRGARLGRLQPLRRPAGDGTPVPSALRWLLSAF
jgi:hypothetical protein